MIQRPLGFFSNTSNHNSKYPSDDSAASDAPSFEMSPLVGPHSAPGGINAGETWETEMQGGGLVHQWLLGGWGVMIGEMWDLERLCEKSKELGRSTCFVSSVPLKVTSCQVAHTKT